eukprot:TRINITY_DN2558_c0_g1_i1.p1 TRINITY_DN2558_c0_g1~~TRINITY_DN2558_c0_g1_i1.p1  ORF type:complete len:338 (+),score=37.45 TRINITY_DN2558_c0_g1_i1:850-1863(+)
MSAGEVADMNALLASTSLLSLKRSQQIHVLNEAASAGDALKVLVKERILSAPIVDQGGKCVGIVDMLDLTHELLISFSAKSPDEIGTAMSDFVRFGAQAVQELCGRLLRGSVLTCEGKSKRNQLVTVNESTSILAAAQQALAKTCHRVAVVNSAGGVVSMVSQTDVVRFLAAHLELLPNASTPIRELELASHAIDTIGLSESGIGAYRRIHERFLSAIAVVDVSGHLVDVISPADLRGVRPTEFARLTLPVREFKKAMHAEGVMPVVTVEWDTTFAEVVRLLVDKKIHRVFVLQHGKPVAVVSLTDVIINCIVFSPPSDINIVWHATLPSMLPVCPP